MGLFNFLKTEFDQFKQEKDEMFEYQNQVNDIISEMQKVIEEHNGIIFYGANLDGVHYPHIIFDHVERVLLAANINYQKPSLTFYYKEPIDFDFEDIISYETNIKGEQALKKHGITRAVTGGLLFGPAGAIVGAVTGGKEYEKISEIGVIFKTSDFERHHLLLNFSKGDSDSYGVKQALIELEEYCTEFDKAIASNNKG